MTTRPAVTLSWLIGHSPTASDPPQVHLMLENVTRSTLIQAWFAAVVLVAVIVIALGTEVTVGTAGLLLALSLVPPAIVLMLWPGPEARTAAEVLRDPERRR